jgi:hypothetical protein
MNHPIALATLQTLATGPLASEAEVVYGVPLEDRFVGNVALKHLHRPMPSLLRDRMEPCTGLCSFPRGSLSVIQELNFAVFDLWEGQQDT